MGVRGLTTFIASRADKYLKTYELHDTYLVIDGNNLAAQLYKWHTKCNDCFGGDYDIYATTVTDFFATLQECNITPLIIFDGGYEARKLRTIYNRMKNKVKQTQRLNCATEGSMTVFPLFLRELFVEIVINLQLKAVRCVSEADYEMACIARKLCCPLLSYDSDFYIFDVLYIPFSTFSVRSTKIRNDALGITYNAIECQVYRIENFLLSFGGLRTDCIPLLGVLLGNDYIKASAFKKFYQHVKLQKRRHSESDQQRRIMAVVKWLQNETYESAVRKILGQIKIKDRKYVGGQIKAITEGYLCAESKLIQYLDVVTNSDCLDSLTLCIKFDLDSMMDNQSELDESSESDNKSDSEDNMKFSVATDFPQYNPKNLPSLFEENYKMCLYPACFMDIMCNNRYFFIPQIENYVNDSSHVISLDILAAIYKMLSFSDENNLTYVLREVSATVRNFQLERSPKQLPQFEQLQGLTNENQKQILFTILDINVDVVNLVNEFPESWRLYILSVIYWMRNAKPNISDSHFYAVILSVLVLKLANPYMQRNEIKFLTKYDKEIQEAIEGKELIVDDSITNLQVALDAITKSDLIMLVKESIPSFQMDKKLRKNPKLFNINIVHSFAQLQSCAFHIKYLNSLLNNPFQGYLISEFYNGTLTYNWCANFMNRSDLDAYLQLMFKYCPNILQSFKIIKSLLSPILLTSVVKTVVAKRKRKKAGKEKVFSENGLASSDNEVGMYDVNNRFSLLMQINK